MLKRLPFSRRYVVRAKAGKKQSSEDAGGNIAHSAGASIRRHNELALTKASKAGNAEKVLEPPEQGSDPCVIDERGRTAYRFTAGKEVRNTFRHFMALNPDTWDWKAAKVPSPLTKEMEESQNVKQVSSAVYSFVYIVPAHLYT
ncbi:hypothetical protein HanHA300_Chr00c0259g0737301 [Helianthus annuus]|nr:hypothetical protein HanHA300_Chr13g0504641 [Helianthus annuus]KAJ0630450.1 hypothetical protein HanHA300_Chr00c0259g0737301 [Helianthus annuus]KAJ0665713.1 hypothetical protein HanLR1_Chr13g0506831 [Helianthus annuus]